MRPTSSMPAPPSRPNWLKPRNDVSRRHPYATLAAATAATMPVTDVVIAVASA